MEHESFESEQVASVMNEHFVNIKVDREERPDVDKVYVSLLRPVIYPNMRVNQKAADCELLLHAG